MITFGGFWQCPQAFMTVRSEKDPVWQTNLLGAPDTPALAEDVHACQTSGWPVSRARPGTARFTQGFRSFTLVGPPLPIKGDNEFGISMF